MSDWRPPGSPFPSLCAVYLTIYSLCTLKKSARRRRPFSRLAKGGRDGFYTRSVLDLRAGEAKRARRGEGGATLFYRFPTSSGEEEGGVFSPLLRREGGLFFLAQCCTHEGPPSTPLPSPALSCANKCSLLRSPGWLKAVNFRRVAFISFFLGRFARADKRLRPLM